MKNNSVEIVPYRIKQARLSRGFSLLELSELLDLTKQAVSQFEMGKTSPSASTIALLANVLKYPLNFFSKPLPANLVASSPVFFRTKRTTKAKALNAAREKIALFREMDDYLRQYVNFPEVNLPKIEYVDSLEPLENELIESYALALRQHWHLGLGPIDSLMNVVQKNGIMVSKMYLGYQKVDAFSVWYNNTPYIFLSNDKKTNVRTRFDIAHELGHLLMHADNFSEEDLKDKVIRDKLENEADRFAGSLLMPSTTFEKDVYSSSIDHFIQLKAKWKSSIGSMIYRCENLGILSSNQIKYLKDQMTTRVYWRREPLDNTMPIEKPFAHKQSVQLLLDNDVLTPYQITEDIACNASEIEEYLFLDEGTLTPTSSSKNKIIELKKV